MTFELRDYQQQSVDFAMNHGIADKPIHVAPCGAGKTVIQVFIAKREMDRGNSTAILTPRSEILNQTLTMAREVCGYENVSVLRAKRDGENWNPVSPVHIVSWPTLIARARRSKFWFPKVDRVLADEAHLSMAPKILEILQHYAPLAAIDGFTATPARMSGIGLGRFFTSIKHVTSVRQLIASGHLSACEYWGGATPDMTGMKVDKGDYRRKPLSKVCVTLVGDIVDNWLRLAADRQTIVFAVDIAHCEALNDRFQGVGIQSRSLHTGLDQEKRDQIVADFKAGIVQVLVNVSVASYGFDAPSVTCIVLARPTKSIVLHIQMLGRAMRPGYGTAMILDHAGNTLRLGHADDLYRWSLDEGKEAAKNWTRMAESGEQKESKDYECGDCGAIFKGQRRCPKCGWEIPFAKRDVEVQEADLVPIGRSLVKKLPDGWPKHEVFFAMLLHEQHTNPSAGKNFAANTFRKKAGCTAPGDWHDFQAIPPDRRVSNYIKSRNYARGAMQRKLRAQGKIR